MNTIITAAPAFDPPASRVARIILDFLGDIPHSGEPPSVSPHVRAAAITARAGRRAFITSASLSLPPGPVGWLTVLPELVAIWKIQAQMVADIAGAFGQKSTLTREQMLYCLFRHTAAQAVRDLAVRAGQRVVVRHVTGRALRNMADRIGVRFSHRAVRHGVSRLLPVVGSIGVGAYAWMDTRQVAHTSIAMFSRPISFEEARSTEIPARRATLDQMAREAGLGA